MAEHRPYNIMVGIRLVISTIKYAVIILQLYYLYYKYIKIRSVNYWVLKFFSIVIFNSVFFISLNTSYF